MRRLKVLFITNWYPTTEEPAKAVWVREHAKAVRLYDDVLVLHCAGADPQQKCPWIAEQETDEKIREGILTYRVWFRPSPIPSTSYFAYLWSVFRAFRHIVNEGFRPDIIHVHIYDAGPPAVLIGKLNHIPIVVSEHFSSFARTLLRRTDVFKAWVAFRWADTVIPVSHALQRAIESYGINARFQVIPNVADTTLFFQLPVPKTVNNPKRILFVGQLAPVRGMTYLLRALSELRMKRDDWRLDIIGEGEARAEYEHLVMDLELCDKVAFHGLKTKPEVAEFMRQADLFVVSSLCETFSVPAAEALASGTPVLATSCGGPEEFITEDQGLLVPPADEAALFQGLAYMLDNLHRYSGERISQYAKKRFAPEVVGAELHAVYRSLCTAAQAGESVR